VHHQPCAERLDQVDVPGWRRAGVAVGGGWQAPRPQPGYDLAAGIGGQAGVSGGDRLARERPGPVPALVSGRTLAS